MSNSHTLAALVAFLNGIKARGSYGQTTIIWRGTDIPLIEHLEQYKPDGLPKASAPIIEGGAHIT